MNIYKKLAWYLITIGGVVYLYFNSEKLYTLKNLAPYDIFILLVTSLLILLINSLQFKALAKSLSIDLKFNEWFGLTVTNTMYNYFTPVRGGLIARAYYLKNKYQLPFSKYLSLLGIAYFVNFVVASISSIIFIFFSYLLTSVFHKSLLYISLVLLFVTLLGFIVCINLDKKFLSAHNMRIIKFINAAIVGLRDFKKKPSLLAKIGTYQFLFIMITGFRLFWAFKSIHIEVDSINIMIIQSLVVFSMVLSITPGNLGVKEGIIGMLASMLEVSMADAVVAAIIDRFIAIIVTFSLGFVFSMILISNINIEKKES